MGAIVDVGISFHGLDRHGIWMAIHPFCSAVDLHLALVKIGHTLGGWCDARRKLVPKKVLVFPSESMVLKASAGSSKAQRPVPFPEFRLRGVSR